MNKIFPEINIITTPKNVEFRTKIRLLHNDGNYYLTDVIHNYIRTGKENDFNVYMNKFLHEAYCYVINGEVNLEIIRSQDDMPIFKKDENQQSEFDRLKIK